VRFRPVAPWRSAWKSASGSTPAFTPSVKISASEAWTVKLAALCASLATVPAPIAPT